MWEGAPPIGCTGRKAKGAEVVMDVEEWWSAG